MDFDFTTETITPDATNLLTIGGTGGLEVPIGTTAERPVIGLVNGTFRYNIDLNLVETYSNSSWTSAVNPGTITSVSGSGGTTGLTLTGGPITSTGTLTLGGILAPASGGTGTNTSTAANGQLLIGNGTGLTLSTLTAGTSISITNGSGSITVNNTGVTSAIGTAGNITVSSATGAVTFNLATAGTPGTYGQVTTDTFGRVTSGGTNSVANGGTGLTTTPTNGQVLIGNGTNYSLSTITAGAGVSVTNGAGTITIAATGATGTVTSVALALPSFITVSGSPVTTSGTLTGTLATQTANTLFAGPTTGGPAAPTFRTLVFNDISSALQLYRENPSAPTTPVASGANSVAIGSGSSSTAVSAVAIGAGTAANVANIFAYANGNFATAGDAQNITVMSRNTTVNATTTELFVDGTSQRLVMPNNSVWTFTIRVVGRRTDATGGWAMYTFQGGTKRDATAATTTLEGSSRTIIDESTGALNCTISADTTNGSLNINVTGIAAQTYRWVATTEITQVTN